MKIVNLNKPALWRPIRNEDTSIRKYSGGYPYLSEGGIVSQSTPLEPVIRYAKNYEKFDLKFSLFIFSSEKDNDKIENFLTTQVKKLTKSEISETLITASASNFTYLDTMYKGSKK